MNDMLSKYGIGLGDLLFLGVTIVSFIFVSAFLILLFVAHGRRHWVHTAERWAVVAADTADRKIANCGKDA